MKCERCGEEIKKGKYFLLDICKPYGDCIVVSTLCERCAYEIAKKLKEMLNG